MTRRIDELGRLVIPKEIRKNLKIKDNDQVEINVVDNKIVLNKYDCINKDFVITNLLNCLRKSINKNILLSSRDKIIEYSLINKEEKENLLLSEEIMNIIENRKDIINYSYKGLVYSMYPLVVNGDLYGSLIIYSNLDINSNESKIIEFSKLFLEKYLE